jgi:hypothetical protein
MKKRTKYRTPKIRLRDLLQPRQSRWVVDLSAAILRLEYGALGRKVYYTTEERVIQNPDGTVSTFTLRFRNIVLLRETESGEREGLLLRFPERIEDVETWSRVFSGLARQQEALWHSPDEDTRIEDSS